MKASLSCFKLIRNGLPFDTALIFLTHNDNLANISSAWQHGLSLKLTVNKSIESLYNKAFNCFSAVCLQFNGNHSHSKCSLNKFCCADSCCAPLEVISLHCWCPGSALPDQSLFCWPLDSVPWLFICCSLLLLRRSVVYWFQIAFRKQWYCWVLASAYWCAYLYVWTTDVVFPNVDQI